MFSQWSKTDGIQPLQASKPSVFCHLVCVCREKRFKDQVLLQVSPVIILHLGSICISSVLVQTRAGLSPFLPCYVFRQLSQEYFVSLTIVITDWSHWHIHTTAPEVVTSTGHQHPYISGLLSTVVEKLPGLTLAKPGPCRTSVWIPLAVEWREIGIPRPEHHISFSFVHLGVRKQCVSFVLLFFLHADFL